MRESEKKGQRNKGSLAFLSLSLLLSLSLDLAPERGMERRRKEEKKLLWPSSFSHRANPCLHFLPPFFFSPKTNSGKRKGHFGFTRFLRSGNMLLLPFFPCWIVLFRENMSTYTMFGESFQTRTKMRLRQFFFSSSSPPFSGGEIL